MSGTGSGVSEWRWDERERQRYKSLSCRCRVLPAPEILRLSRSFRGFMYTHYCSKIDKQPNTNNMGFLSSADVKAMPSEVFNWRLVFATLSAAMAGSLFGFDTGKHVAHIP